MKILYVGNKLSHHGFTPGVIETLGPLLEKEGYEVSYAGTFRNQFLRLTEILWKTLAARKKVDFILIDTFSTSAFWYALLASSIAKVQKVPYIPLLHGGDLPKRIKRSKRFCYMIFNHSYANIAVSGYLQHEFKKAGYKSIIIPNFIDLSKYPFKLREDPQPRLLWVRSFHKIYNPNMAADVLEILMHTHKDAELCIVGPDKDGSMEEFKNYIKSKGIDTHVKITGKLTKEDWITLSKDYDFFINTTNVDNTPVSVIEAMALGLIVVSTNPGGISYMLNDGNNSVLLRTGDYIKMAERINMIIDNTILACTLSSNARKKAKSFDWGVIRKDWIQLLNLKKS